MSDRRGLKIPNPVNLNKKVPELPRSSALDPISRAEQALEKLSGTFEHWMDAEIKRLTEAWSQVSTRGFNAETLAALYSVCHDIKGEAATFGFPLAGDVADTLCGLLDVFEDNPANAPTPLIEQYVLAIKAIVNEKVQNSADPVARQLVDELAMQADRAIEMFSGRKPGDD